MQRPICSACPHLQRQGVTPPLIRLRAQNHRVFFRERADHFQIERVLDRKEAYR